ncbi:Peptidoglycan-associated lipoprotein [Nitrospira sp. KM1]|uniref:OmpA family protein n=1 Tax=Nitrospira sp. KM1 TaxID=1936990 RepID=UPI0013A733B2|nr:OmpA family protein [Nitrospira sp. KM1]BCA55299.1 Peptidoglycan-associated lipoprotein [Nitrospira sp. KM1]
MKRDSIGPKLTAIVLCLSALGLLAGCGKRALSSAGDEAAGAKRPAPEAPVETIQPDRMATIPEEPRTSMETARAPLAPSSSSAAGGSSRQGPASAESEETDIDDIYFDYDRFTIRKDAQEILEANASRLMRSKGNTLLIEGHCDERGTLAYNLVLGEKRARSTKQYLEELGVPASRMKIISYGEIRPFCKEHEDTCWQKNRRAHFVLR